MKINQTQTKAFRVPKQQYTALYGVFAIIALSTIISYFFDKALAYKLSILLIFCVLALAGNLWVFARATISLNDNGIWNTKQNETQNIAWKTITQLKFKQSQSGKLKLCDKHGKTLLKISPLLDNLDELCEIILTKSATAQSINQTQQSFTRLNHRIFYICACFLVIVVGALTYFAPRNDSCCSKNAGDIAQDCIALSPEIATTLITTLLITLLALAYITTIYRLKINSSNIELFYPFRRKVIPFQSIKTMQILSFQQIKVIIDNKKKPLFIPTLDTDALTLYCCLKHAMEKNRNDHER